MASTVLVEALHEMGSSEILDDSNGLQIGVGGL